MAVGTARRGGIVWKRPPSELAKDFEAFGENLIEEAIDVQIEVAADMEDYAKANHPWTNRTGRAERGLQADVERRGDEIISVLAQIYDDRRWLEIAMSAKWAIVLPTLQRFYPQVLQRLHNAALEAGKETKR